MDYLSIYQDIIKQSKKQNRSKHRGTYYESHHIVPRCLGGSNNSYNKVLLTAREHFICHTLLWKACINLYGKSHWKTHKMLVPVIRMKSDKINSRIYESAKAHLSEYMRINNPMHNAKHRKTMGLAKRGKKFKKVNNTQILWNKGKITGPRSAESIIKQSISSKGHKKPKSYSDKLSKRLKGVPKSKDHREALRQASIGKRWMNNGIVCKLVKSANIKQYLNDDYVFGKKLLNFKDAVRPNF